MVVVPQKENGVGRLDDLKRRRQHREARRDGQEAPALRIHLPGLRRDFPRVRLPLLKRRGPGLIGHEAIGRVDDDEDAGLDALDEGQGDERPAVEHEQVARRVVLHRGGPC